MGGSTRHRHNLIVKYQDTARVLLDPQSQIGKTNTDRLFDEQAAADEFLQPLHLHTDGGLGELELFGGLGEAPELR